MIVDTTRPYRCASPPSISSTKKPFKKDGAFLSRRIARYRRRQVASPADSSTTTSPGRTTAQPRRCGGISLRRRGGGARWPVVSCFLSGCRMDGGRGRSLAMEGCGVCALLCPTTVVCVHGVSTPDRECAKPTDDRGVDGWTGCRAAAVAKDIAEHRRQLHGGVGYYMLFDASDICSFYLIINRRNRDSWRKLWQLGGSYVVQEVTHSPVGRHCLGSCYFFPCRLGREGPRKVIKEEGGVERRSQSGGDTECNELVVRRRVS